MSSVLNIKLHRPSARVLMLWWWGVIYATPSLCDHNKH